MFSFTKSTRRDKTHKIFVEQIKVTKLSFNADLKLEA